MWTSEPDPAMPGWFRVTAGDRTAAVGLTEGDADVYAGLLNAVDEADARLMGAMRRAAGDECEVEAIGSPDFEMLVNEMMLAAGRLDSLKGHRLGESFPFEPRGP